MAGGTKNTSLLVSSQLPEFIAEDYPKFVEFLQAYYKFQADNYNVAIEKLRDPDAVTDQLLIFLRRELIRNFPTAEIDDRKLLGLMRQLYARKGTIDGIKLLFQIFFNDAIVIHKPGEKIIRASDSKWDQYNFVTLETINWGKVVRDLRRASVGTTGPETTRFNTTATFTNEIGMTETRKIGDISSNGTIGVEDSEILGKFVKNPDSTAISYNQKFHIQNVLIPAILNNPLFAVYQNGDVKEENIIPNVSRMVAVNKYGRYTPIISKILFEENRRLRLYFKSYQDIKLETNQKVTITGVSGTYYHVQSTDGLRVAIPGKYWQKGQVIKIPGTMKDTVAKVTDITTVNAIKKTSVIGSAGGNQILVGDPKGIEVGMLVTGFNLYAFITEIRGYTLLLDRDLPYDLNIKTASFYRSKYGTDNIISTVPTTRTAQRNDYVQVSTVSSINGYIHTVTAGDYIKDIADVTNTVNHNVSGTNLTLTLRENTYTTSDVPRGTKLDTVYVTLPTGGIKDIEVIEHGGSHDENQAIFVSPYPTKPENSANYDLNSDVVTSTISGTGFALHHKLELEDFIEGIGETIYGEKGTINFPLLAVELTNAANGNTNALSLFNIESGSIKIGDVTSDGFIRVEDASNITVYNDFITGKRNTNVSTSVKNRITQHLIPKLFELVDYIQENPTISLAYKTILFNIVRPKTPVISLSFRETNSVRYNYSELTMKEWVESRAMLLFKKTDIVREKGAYRNDQSLLSNSESRLQDNYFYQLFSYVVETSKSGEDVSYVLNQFHPAGMKYFFQLYKKAEYNIRDVLESYRSFSNDTMFLNDVTDSQTETYSFYVTKELEDDSNIAEAYANLFTKIVEDLNEVTVVDDPAKDFTSVQTDASTMADDVVKHATSEQVDATGTTSDDPAKVVTSPQVDATDPLTDANVTLFTSEQVDATDTATDAPAKDFTSVQTENTDAVTDDISDKVFTSVPDDTTESVTDAFENFNVTSGLADDSSLIVDVAGSPYTRNTLDVMEFDTTKYVLDQPEDAVTITSGEGITVVTTAYADNYFAEIYTQLSLEATIG